MENQLIDQLSTLITLANKLEYTNEIESCLYEIHLHLQSISRSIVYLKFHSNSFSLQPMIYSACCIFCFKFNTIPKSNSLTYEVVQIQINYLMQ